jgi:hypothetical protein
VSLHTDIPTRADVDRLLESRHPAGLSLYLPAAETDDAVAYGVADEIGRRMWLTGGRVRAVRRDDIPGDGPVAAILRYAL